MLLWFSNTSHSHVCFRILCYMSSEATLYVYKNVLYTAIGTLCLAIESEATSPTPVSHWVSLPRYAVADSVNDTSNNTDGTSSCAFYKSLSMVMTRLQMVEVLCKCLGVILVDFQWYANCRWNAEFMKIIFCERDSTIWMYPAVIYLSRRKLTIWLSLKNLAE